MIVEEGVKIDIEGVRMNKVRVACGIWTSDLFVMSLILFFYEHVSFADDFVVEHKRPSQLDMV